MSALPDGPVGFYTDKFNECYNNICDFNSDIGTSTKSGFLNTVILEYCPNASYDNNYLWMNLKPAPSHPRAYNINFRDSSHFHECFSGYEDVCCGYTDGKLDGDGKIEITKMVRIGSSQEWTAPWYDARRDRVEGLSSQQTVCYVTVPFVEGTGDSRYFWVDLNKGIRAVYFPVMRKYSDQTRDLSMWVKLDLSTHLHNRTYRPFPSQGSTGNNYNWTTSKPERDNDVRGLLHTDTTIYVDVFEYVTQALSPPHFRSKDVNPYDAVFWGYSNIMQSKWHGTAFALNLDKKEGSFIKRQNNSLVGTSKGVLRVDKHDSYSRGIPFEQQKRKIYPEWISSVTGAASFGLGFIPFVGPLLSLGVDMMQTVAEKNINDDWGDIKELAIGSTKKTGGAVWDTIPDEQQKKIKAGLRKTAMGLLKSLGKSISGSGFWSLDASKANEYQEYQGLTIIGLWAEEDEILNHTKAKL